MSLIDVAEATTKEIQSRNLRASYKHDPVLWAKHVAGAHLWSRQADVAVAVAGGNNVAVKAGHGVGKSYLAALLICWWIDTRYPNCFVASTAPSSAQIGAIVWREVRNMKAAIGKRYKEGLIDHELPGYITADNQWKTDEGVIVGFGRKPPDQKTDDAFQGLHAQEGVLAIGDEAVGLTEEMIDALGNITSTSNSARLLICNPTNPASYVGQLFKKQPSNWSFHTISVLDSPNFTDEKDETPAEVLAALTDETYVNSKREEYGEGTPRWMSRVEGEFAWDQGFTLFRVGDLAKAYDCEVEPSSDTRPVLGVDVSRSKAGDKNTVYKYHDGKLRFVEAWNDDNAINTAQRIHDLALANAVSEVRIDGTGIGGPIADYVRDLAGSRYEVLEILGANTSPDINRWYNFRAWAFWALQDRMAKGLIDIDVTDEELSDQLLGIEIKKRTSGRDNLLLESKEDMRKRGVSSPDHADAAMYASIDLGAYLGNPYNSYNPGDKVVKTPDEVLGGMMPVYGSPLVPL